MKRPFDPKRRKIKRDWVADIWRIMPTGMSTDDCLQSLTLALSFAIDHCCDDDAERAYYTDKACYVLRAREEERRHARKLH